MSSLRRRRTAVVVSTTAVATALIAGLGAAGAAVPGAEDVGAKGGVSDAWARDFTFAEYADHLDALQGTSTGVGVRLRIERDRLVIADVDRGSPADEAGVRAGEQVVAVGGRSVSGGDLPEVLRRLRDGGVATTLSGPSGVREVAMEAVSDRRRGVSAVDLASGAQWVKVDAVVRGVAARVDEVLGEGDGGVVLDLRSNGGGLVTEAVDLAGVFVDGGRGLSYRTSDGRGRTFDLPVDGRVEAPLVVLVDGATASAAEIVAGILQDRGRAVIIGTRTFGKGTVQEPIALEGGGVRERTVGEYQLPSGRSIDGIGITPDVTLAVDANETDVLATAAAVLEGLAPLRPQGR